MSQSTPTKHDERAVLLAVAELLVYGADSSRGATGSWGNGLTCTYCAWTPRTFCRVLLVENVSNF